jgi:hypothetical protein
MNQIPNPLSEEGRVMISKDAGEGIACWGG